MRQPKRFCRIAVILTVLLLSGCKDFLSDPQIVEAEKIRSSFVPKPRNVSLVLDTSGSMQTNDANRMMLYSAMLFTDLLEANDHLTVITYPGSGTVKTEAQLQQVMPSWARNSQNMMAPCAKNDMKRFIRMIAYDSSFTIFKEPMEKAVGVVGEGAEDAFSKRAVVFFSDGATDRHNLSRANPQLHSVLAADHQAETDALRREIVPALKDKNITFYGVILGRDTITSHFDMMADATGGLVRKAARPEDLAANFTEIFSRILQTEVEKIELNGDKPADQVVNNYVKELIIVVPTRTLDEAKKISLHVAEPSAKTMAKAEELHTGSRQNSTPDIWSRTTSITDGLTVTVRGEAIEAGGYAIWKIKKPKTGEWKIKLEGGTSGAVQAIVIQNYGIYLEVEGNVDRSGMVGEPNAFKARLITEEGEPITDPDFYNKNNFRYEFFVDGKKITDMKPDQSHRLLYDFVPQDEGRARVMIAAKNELFLNVNVPVEFTAYKDVALKLSGSIDLGERIPWTDWFLEKLGGLFGPRIWTPGSHWKQNTAVADFKGSARNAEGVRFKIDNTELYRRMKAKVLNEDGTETFYLDKNMEVKFLMDIDRDSDGGDLSGISVPISTMSGKSISGVTHLPLKGHIVPLSPWSWKYSHLWLEELIILWMILFFIGKPVVYCKNSFSRNHTYYKGDREKFEQETEGRDVRNKLNYKMGRTLLVRILLSYFQFIWGQQITGVKDNYILRKTSLASFFWFILAIILPVPLADVKKIDVNGKKREFYRFGGCTYLRKRDHEVLVEKEDEKLDTIEDEEQKANPYVLVPIFKVEYPYEDDNGLRIFHTSDL